MQPRPVPVGHGRLTRGNVGDHFQGEEHLDNYGIQDEEKSILWAHSVHHHGSRVDVVYMMRVSGAYNEPLYRQIMERVQISN